MADRVLSLRALNRAMLARQLLLERSTMRVPEAIEQVGGLQAQLAIAPYVSLWSRLREFGRDDLAALIENHTVVKATMMRATLHLVTAADYLLLRETLQPALGGASESITKQRGAEFDSERIIAAARAFISAEPRSFAEISAMLTELMPDVDVGSMRYTVRMNLPMVQVPTDTTWSFPGNPKFTLAEAWLGQAIPARDHLTTLIKRYLAAFGPASIKDIETWSGLGKLKVAVESLRPELVTYRDEKKRELFDLPDAPLPDADSPAPVRFLPEYDNVLRAYDVRTRVIADEHRKQVYLPALRVAATVLVDGFVAGVWKIEVSKKHATLVIEPFAPLRAEDHAALMEEGERLVRFAESSAKSHEVKFEK